LKLDQLRNLLAGDNLERIKKQIERRDQIDAEIEKLGSERNQIDNELQQILGDITSERQPSRQPGERRQRKCRLCGQTGHIIRRRKTQDGRPTCDMYPEGRPEAAA
jgi:uncharacterized coiled-coil DUF342 family protein